MVPWVGLGWLYLYVQALVKFANAPPMISRCERVSVYSLLDSSKQAARTGQITEDSPVATWNCWLVESNSLKGYSYHIVRTLRIFFADLPPTKL